MCGRTACTLSPEELCKACSWLPGGSKHYVIPQWVDHPGSYIYSPSTNMAPSVFSPVFFKNDKNSRKRDLEGELKSSDDYIVQPMMWGLIPPFYKGGCPKSHGLKTNNCRIEDVVQKKSYFPSLKNGQRCVVVVDGFYEWQTTEESKNKQPYFIHAPQQDGIEIWNKDTWCSDLTWDNIDGWKGVRPLKMAGLYSHWTSLQGEEIYSYTVLTKEADKKFSSIHHRIPAILNTQEDVEKWLRESDYEIALSNLHSDPDLSWYPVSTRVNNSRNQEKDLFLPHVATKQEKKTSSSSKLMASWLISAKDEGHTRQTKSNELSKGGKSIEKSSKNNNTILNWLKKKDSSSI